MEKLPVELLIQVFSELEPEDLQKVAQVSRAWRQCCSETTWRSHFLTKFGTLDFTPIQTQFSWQQEVLSRHRALKAWNKAKLPALKYRLDGHTIGDTAVNWDNRMLFSISEESGNTSISHLETGAGHRTSKRAIPFDLGLDQTPSATCTSKFGILAGYYSGTIVFTAMGERPVVVYHFQHRVQLVWLSDTFMPAKSSKVTIVAASGKQILFFSQFQLIGEFVLDTGLEEDTARAIVPIGDGFLVLSQQSLYRISHDFKAMKIMDTDAKNVYAAYPYILLVGNRLTRVNLETTEQKEFTRYTPIQLACDKNLVAVYTIADQMVTAWSIKSGEIIWQRPCDLSLKDPNSFESISAMALNPVVLVCGGYDGDMCVLNVLTGEKLPPKRMKAAVNRIWRPQNREIRSTSTIHLGAATEAIMAHINDDFVTVYDANGKKPTKKAATVPHKKIQQVQVDHEEIDMLDDYTVRRINRENLTPSNDLSEEEQLATAIALSESHTPVLSEADQMKLALAESIAQPISEEEQMRLALELSMGTSRPASTDGEATTGTEIDEELQRALDASMIEQ